MLTGQILLQLIVILIAVQIFGLLCKKIGQQWVIGEILAGLALGPSLLGAFLPRLEGFLFPISSLPTLQTLGDIGLVLYMFSLGTRLDTHSMLKQSRQAMLVSLSGILVPLSAGAALAFFLFPSLGGARATLLAFMLMVGTSLAMTAFPVLARLLSERNMLGTAVGTFALTCAAIGDVVAWCLLALVIAIASMHGWLYAASLIGLTILFIGVMFALVRPLLTLLHRRIRSKQTLFILSIILLLLSAYCTNAIGIHPIFGAFLMGVVFPRNVLSVELVHDIDQINAKLFLPLYFVYSGLHTQIGLINSPWLWLICLVVFMVACIGKISGSTCAARLTGESWRDACCLGILMNTRGLVELIVINIGLDLHILSPTIFAMLVIAALLTTMMAAPLLSLFGRERANSSENSSAQLQSVENLF